MLPSEEVNPGLVSVSEVLAHSLGICVVDPVTKKNNRMSVIIKKGSSLPTKETRRYFNAYIGDTIPIDVYQGEERLVEGNILLANCEIKSNRVCPPKKFKVLVTFEFSADAIFRVTAVPQKERMGGPTIHTILQLAENSSTTGPGSS